MATVKAARPSSRFPPSPTIAGAALVMHWLLATVSGDWLAIGRSTLSGGHLQRARRPDRR